jgi:hypothetical protein
MEGFPANNRFVLPKAIEPFKPDPSALASFAEERGAATVPSFLSPFTKPSSGQQATQIIDQQLQAKAPLEQALFNQTNGMEMPLFNQIMSSLSKSLLPKSAAKNEKSEAQEKAAQESGSGEDTTGVKNGTLLGKSPSPGIPSYPMPLPSLSNPNYRIKEDNTPLSNNLSWDMYQMKGYFQR